MPFRIPHLFFLTVFLSSLAFGGSLKPASGSQDAPSFKRHAPLPAWAQPLAEPDASHRTDPYVVRVAETQAFAGATPAILINRQMQANERNSLEKIGQLSIDYYPAYQKLLLHRVAIIRDGHVFDRTMTVNIRFLQREQNLEIGQYSGALTAQLLLDDVRIGDTLWVVYTTEGSNPVFGNRWTEYFSWDGGDPIDLRRLTVLYPSSRRIKWRQFGDFRAEQLTPKIDEISGLRRMRFEGRNIERVEFEQSIPTDYFPLRFLQFSEYQDWNEVAKWANSLFPSPKIGNELARLIAQFNHETTPPERAAAALRWVQNEIRYFSVSIGENSHRPYDPNLVIKRRYGDCKDKAYLLVTLLHGMGIDAHPVLVSSKDPKTPSRMMASPMLFDHAIVEIGLEGKKYYVDPTQLGQVSPLDKLGIVLPEASALVTSPASTDLIMLPGSRPDREPIYERAEKIVLKSFDGDATLDVRQTYRRSGAEYARVNFPTMPKEDLRRFMLSLYEKRYPGVKLTADPVFTDDAANNLFYLTAQYNLPTPAVEKDNRYSIEYETDIFDNSLGIPDKIVRQFPLALSGARFTGRYHLDIFWPNGARLNQPRVEDLVDNPFFRAEEEYLFRGNHLAYMVDYRVKPETVAALDVPKLQKESKKLDNFIRGSFNVNKDGILSDEFAKYSYRELDEFRQYLLVKQIADKYKSGKITEKDSMDLCSVFDMLYKFSDRDPGTVRTMLDNIERELNRVPDSKDVHTCLARLLFNDGNFKESKRHFLQAGELTDESDRIKLIWSRFYIGEVEQAIDDISRFRKEIETAGKALDPLIVAQEMAMRNLAKFPIPDEVLKFARQAPDGPWPRPLLAVLAQDKTKDVLIHDIGTLPPDERDMDLTQARFYMGMSDLAEQRWYYAQEDFLWVRNKGVRSFDEYSRAQFVLSELVSGRLRKSAEALRYMDWFDGKTGPDVPGDAEALAWFTQNAKEGNAVAQLCLGLIYKDGKGVTKDLAQAEKWLRKAAQQGEVHAQSALKEFSNPANPATSP